MIFADAKYDYPYDGPVRQTYMIAGARRTGTTWLGQRLWETSQLGKPFEYQLPENMEKIMSRVPDGMGYFEFLHRMRTTPNGVFAFKEVSPAAYHDYRRGNSRPDHIVYIARRDEVYQAVSLTIAEQTAAFFSFQSRKRDPVYNYWEIMNAFIGICEVKRMWEDIFAEERIAPLRLVYEDIGANTPRRIARHIGVELLGEGQRTDAPRIEKQGNGINEEWAARFRREMESNGCSVVSTV